MYLALLNMSLVLSSCPGSAKDVTGSLKVLDGCKVLRVNCRGWVQRRFNTLSLLDYYLGPGKLTAQDIAWNPNDPNVLNMALPGVASPHQMCSTPVCQEDLSLWMHLFLVGNANFM